MVLGLWISVIWSGREIFIIEKPGMAKLYILLDVIWKGNPKPLRNCWLPVHSELTD